METEVVKLQSVNEFCRLFKLSVPTRKHFDYYINTLSRSKEFEDIHSLVQEYADFELWCQENGYTSVKNYKLDYALPLLSNTYKRTEAFNLFNSKEVNSVKLRSLDNIDCASPDDNLVSLDFKTANFYCIKQFDADNELGDSWQDLCDKLGIHKTLAKSKSFRQYVFGQLNPSRNQRFQHEAMIKFLDEIIDKGLVIDKDIAFISADEIVLNMGPGNIDWNKINAILDASDSLLPLKLVLKEVYQLKSKTLKAVSFPKVYKTLRKVPGNKFYIFFKQHVLEEELDQRDLLFENDGEVASWQTIGGLEAKINN